MLSLAELLIMQSRLSDSIRCDFVLSHRIIVLQLQTAVRCQACFCHQRRMLFAACIKEQTDSLRCGFQAAAHFHAYRQGIVRPCTNSDLGFAYTGLCAS